MNDVAAWFWVREVAAIAWVAVTEADGVTEFDGAEAVPVPAELAAVTVKVYVVPLVKPVMVIGDPLPVALMPPGFEVTV